MVYVTRWIQNPEQESVFAWYILKAFYFRYMQDLKEILDTRRSCELFWPYTIVVQYWKNYSFDIAGNL